MPVIKSFLKMSLFKKNINLINYLSPALPLIYFLLLSAGCEKIENRNFYKYAFVISIYEGSNIFDLMPRKNNPVLTGVNITDAQVSSVADPFLIRKGEKWYIFFEAYQWAIHKGVIAYAESEDNCHTWKYGKIILDKPWHQSFPCVFEYNGDYFMVPESKHSGSTWLYKAVNFPEEWSAGIKILNIPLVDPVIFRKDGRWYMFGLSTHNLLLFHSDSLERGWKEHPSSPVIKGDKKYRRPGGGVYSNGKDYYRIAQDCESDYGTAIHIFKILELTPTKYREIPVPDNYNLHAGAEEWAKHGIHTCNIQQYYGDRIIAVVDGY